MRKMILALVVVLLTAPAWASVQIIIEDEGDGVAAIKYDSTGETELVRAFALDITITSGECTIVDVTDFAVGDDNGGYGIFPANFSRHITVDGQTGEVADWNAEGYTPVADANDTGAAGALGGTAITIEMGSLYDQVAPGKTGTLCKIAYEGSGTVSATLNAVRGGIVLENAAQANLDASQCTDVAIGEEVCQMPTSEMQADWIAFGKPDCWCTPYHCDGDADTLEQGLLAKKHRVGTNDLQVLIDNWGAKGTEAGYNPCADVDHKSQGLLAKKHRVGTNDLQVLIDNWGAKTEAMAGTCPR